MDDLFIRPGDAAGPAREPARLRAGERFRGINGKLVLVLVLVLVAVSAVVAVAAVFGGSVLAGSSLKGGAPAPRHSTPPLAPQPATASASGSPSARVSGSPSVTVSGSPPAPAPRLNQTGAAPAAAGAAAQHATPHMSQAPAVTSPAPTVAASPTATSGQPAVTVSYAVDEQAGDQFEAEVDVTNDGSSPVSGWQIVVALPDDQVTALENATGYMSNHILLLQPASSGSAIAPGATLRVYIYAQGTQTAPELCAFDNVSCG